MADPVLKFPPEQKGEPPARPRIKIAAEPRRRLMAAMRRYRRFLLLVVLPLVALVAGDHLLSQRRPLRDHRRRLCRRAEGADHARRLRQDHQRDRQGRPAGRNRRRPVPDRSGAVPAGADAGAGQARRRQDQPRQSRRQRQALWADHRNRQRRHRAEAEGRRAQEFAGEEQCRIAARSRQQRHRTGDRAGAAADRDAAALERPQPAARRSRPAARTISGLHAGQGRARRRPAQPRSDHGARADERHRDPGRADPARPPRHGRQRRCFP